MVVGDSAWEGVVPTTGFTQIQPNEGRDATQKTEVFIGYTNTALYTGSFGARAGGFNLNWDGSWNVEARLTDAGWAADVDTVQR